MVRKFQPKGGSPILIRDYGAVYKSETEDEGKGNKIYFNPVNFALGKVLLTQEETLFNNWSLTEKEFKDLKENVKKIEGSYNLISTPHYEGIKGTADPRSEPKANDQYLEGWIKSKSRGYYEASVKQPYLNQIGELLLNDISCQCADSLHASKKGGDWTTITSCVHSSALWTDLIEYLKKDQDQPKNKKGWDISPNRGLANELFIPFNFIVNEELKLEEEIVTGIYNEAKGHYELNNELLHNPDYFSEEFERLINQGEIEFEILQQDRKKEEIAPKKALRKSKAAKFIDKALKEHGFNRSGKYLEEGLPADRYETESGEKAVGVIYPDKYKIEEDQSPPILLATKELNQEKKLEGNHDPIDPIDNIGVTLTRIDDKTRKQAKVKFSTIHNIEWPGTNKSIRPLPDAVDSMLAEDTLRSIINFSERPEYALKHSFDQGRQSELLNNDHKRNLRGPGF